MEPTANPTAIVRRHLRKLVDSLTEELELKLGSDDTSEQELETCFLKLKDKVERLRISDNQFLSSLTSTSDESIDIEKELEDIDVYQEKWVFIKTKYERYKEGQKGQAEQDAVEKNKKSEEKLEYKNKDWSQDPTKLEYPALGTDGYIGQLYDARTNKYFPKTLFSTKILPTEFIQVDELDETEIKIGKSNQLSDRFQLLGVQPEQQLSILNLPAKLSRHGEYLLNEKKSLRSSASTLLYRYSTRKETLIAPVEKIESFIDKDVFQYAKYTHVVVGVCWGSICTLTLELYNEDENEKENMETSLRNKLNYLRLLIESQTQGRMNDNDGYDKSTDVILKMCSDVPNEQKAGSIKEASEFMLKIPELIRNEKGGCGVPLSYILVSRAAFANLFTSDIAPARTLRSIDESCIVATVCFFEELTFLKQKLHDFENDYYKYECYIAGNILQDIKNYQRNIETIQVQIKTDLCGLIPKIRSGEAEIRDLVMTLEKYKSPDSDLTKIMENIKDYKLYHDIAIIDQCSLSDIIFLKKNEKLSQVVCRKENCDSYVLYTSVKLFEADISVSEKTFNLFWTMAENREDNTQFIIADLDVNLSVPYQRELKIFYYKNGQIASKDVLADKETEKSRNYVRLRSYSGMTKTTYKPIQRTILKLVCPGVVSGTCRKEPVTWNCSTCEEVLEYGFDDHFYCHCGKGPNVSFEFKCSSAGHGDNFLAISRRFPLKQELNKLQPFKEMNILILGQSGVGKSTWINSIANYFQYETLEEAQEGGVTCVIPTSFSITYTTNEKVMKQMVAIGDADPNETTDVGKSATKDPKTYNFIYKSRAIRLIDTPGLGDTNGYEQDKENMRKILDHIGFLKEIHGICILLKSNETRIDVIFRFCINELLTHLHRNAARNILFCFTHSRSAFYSLGDTSTVLENLLKELGLKEMISLNKKTTFCLDNEAFRYLCSLRYKNIPWTGEDEKIYKISWEKSVAETRRLFERIQDLVPHKVADTTILCHARNRILNLMKPMVDITQTIQSNIAAIKNQENKIRDNQENLEKLAEKLRMPQIMLEAEALPFPMTVCTNSKCVTYVQLEQSNVTMADYTQVCHDHCSLPNVTSEKYPNEALRQCHIFNYDIKREKCGMCGCNWDSHMHITYKQKRIETYVVDPTIEDEINSKKDAATKIEEHKQQLMLKTKEYESEQDIIMQICLKFAAFLRENCITPYNDAFKDYLKYLIKLETDKANKTDADDNIIQNLKDTMRDYEEQVKILDESSKHKDKDSKNVTAQEIGNLEQELYSLRLTGEQIKKCMEVSMASGSVAQRYAEQPLPIRTSVEKEE